MTKPKVPNQLNVGLLAGVSRATVSQVLNNKAGFSVPLETRERVLAAAAELGYVPNASARNLRTQKTQTIGVVIQDINNPFYPAFVRGVQDIAEQVGYDVISYNTDSAESRERHFVDVLLRGRVDGVVGVFWHVTPPDLKRLTDRGIPVAMLGQASQGAHDLIDLVYIDDHQAACHAVQHLLAAGHHRISMVAGPGGVLQDRVRGYVSALEQAGLGAQIDIVTSQDFTEEGGYQVGSSLLSRSRRPQAVFAANDLIALGVLRASRELGLNIPEDVALVGFDDIPAARLVTPTLTTVRPFQAALGRRCAEMLMERLSAAVTDVQGRTAEMPYELMIRGST